MYPKPQMTLVLIGISALFWSVDLPKIEVIWALGIHMFERAVNKKNGWLISELDEILPFVVRIDQYILDEIARSSVFVG